MHEFIREAVRVFLELKSQMKFLAFIRRPANRIMLKKFSKPGIVDGGLTPGGAALKVDEFLAIVTAI